MTGQALRHTLWNPGRGQALRRGRGVRPWLVAVVLAAVVGATAAVAPIPAVIIAGGVAMGLGMTAAGERSRRHFLVALAGLLIGYAFLSRGFAYLGVRPVFIGELVLGLGVWAFVRALPRARLGLPSACILLFMGWGALQTLPYVGTYGIDALRDAVTWEYAAFALIVGAFARPEDGRAIAGLYGRLVPVFLVWVPIVTALTLVGFAPILPGMVVPLIMVKQGDLGVQLAGVAAFLLAGLYRGLPVSRIVPESILWLGWLLAAAIIAAQNRGAMLAMAIAGLTLVLLRPTARWLRVFAVALVVLVVAIGLNPTIETDRRSLSVTQVITNVISVFDDTGDDDLDGTRNWRLAWWETIVNYTFEGPHFWTGKGFGVNLADDDGFQVGDVGTETSLRAPHNGHMEILARTGVPGFGLWVLLNVVWLLAMLRALVRARRASDGMKAGMLAWLIVLWGAALVNATFDVYLQGPHGGIWFWSVVGLGIALARAPAASDPGLDAPERASPRQPALGAAQS